jgi:hypothetical protein
VKRLTTGEKKGYAVVVLGAIMIDTVRGSHKKTSSVLTTARGFDRLSVKNCQKAVIVL